jgi:hypothetical protein
MMKRKNSGVTKALAKNATKLCVDDTLAWIRRSMWPALDERIDRVFFGFCEHPSVQFFGGLYLSRPIFPNERGQPALLSCQRIHSTHISAGHRLLGLSLLDEDGNGFTIASEVNAQLWYAESPSGQVLVFVSP